MLKMKKMRGWKCEEGKKERETWIKIRGWNSPLENKAMAPGFGFLSQKTDCIVLSANPRPCPPLYPPPFLTHHLLHQQRCRISHLCFPFTSQPVHFYRSRTKTVPDPFPLFSLSSLSHPLFPLFFVFPVLRYRLRVFDDFFPPFSYRKSSGSGLGGWVFECEWGLRRRWLIGKGRNSANCRRWRIPIARRGRIAGGIRRCRRCRSSLRCARKSSPPVPAGLFPRRRIFNGFSLFWVRYYYFFPWKELWFRRLAFWIGFSVWLASKLNIFNWFFAFEVAKFWLDWFDNRWIIIHFFSNQV